MTILSSNNAQCPSVTRVFHPIGQGGFYTEDVNGKLVVYDCGGNSTAFIKDYLKSFLQKGQTIAAVFISHLHWDHINGLEKLFSECNVEKLYLPQLTKNRIIETILYNSIHFPESNANGKSIVNFVEQIINGSIPAIQVIEEGNIDNNEEYQDRYIHSGSHIKVSENATGGVDYKWVYIPYTPLSIKSNFESNDKYVQKIKNIYEKSSDVELAKNVAELLKDLNHIELQKLYTTLYKKPHNSQSMTVFSGFLNTNYKILTRTNVASMSYVCSSCYCSRENHNDSSIRIIPCNFLYT